MPRDNASSWRAFVEVFPGAVRVGGWQTLGECARRKGMRLSERQQAVAVLRFAGGMSMREIARATRVSKSTVDRDVARIVKVLRELRREQ